MTNEHYEAVLADLEGKRDELNVAIATLRRAMGIADAEDAPAVATGRANLSRPDGIRSDEFFGMSILAAAKKFLALVKQPTPAPNIAREIKAHGLMNESKTFSGTVYSILYRESQRPRGTVIQVSGSNKWGLTEWYPGRAKQQGKQAEAAHLIDSGGAPDPILPEQPDEQSQSDEPS